MPLLMAKLGEVYTITRVSGTEEMRLHLNNLGFVVDGQISVVSELDGNLIVNVKGSRIGISREMAAKIMIRQEGEGMKNLREAKIGETVTVVKLRGEGAVKRRIMDMGLTKGATVYIRKVAPLGDPIEVTVRGYELSLRKADAELIDVEQKGLLFYEVHDCSCW